jgi:hypothetical protein
VGNALWGGAQYVAETEQSDAEDLKERADSACSVLDCGWTVIYGLTISVTRFLMGKNAMRKRRAIIFDDEPVIFWS